MKKTLLLILFSFLFFSILANAKGTLQIKSNITDAFVYVDGKKKAMLGEEYTELYLAEGEYHIEIRKKSVDGSYTHKGAKLVFVGDNTKTKINIKTKKIYSDSKIKNKSKKNKKDSYTEHSRKLAKMVKKYYDNLNNKQYYKSYSMLTSNYKNNVSYKRYKQFWGDEIKKVSIIWAEPKGSVIDRNKLKFKLKLAHIKYDNSIYCEEATFSYIYKDTWFLDKKTNSTTCKPVEYKGTSLDGIIKVEVPPYFLKGKSVKAKVTMTSKHNLKKGGVTISFLNRKNVDIQDFNSSFDTTKHYKANNKMWNKKLKKSIPIKYDVFEGWTNNWGNNKTKILHVTIHPKGNQDLFIAVRGIQLGKNKKEYVTPSYGYVDQQGYNSLGIAIPILN